MVAATVVVYIQTNVSWFLGFIIPTICFGFSITSFLLGVKTYVRSKPQGSIICDLVKVVVASSRKRHVGINRDSELSFYYPPLASSKSEQRLKKLAQTNRFRCFDKAVVITDLSERDNNGRSINSWRLCSVQQVEELKSVLATLPVWVAGDLVALNFPCSVLFLCLRSLPLSQDLDLASMGMERI
ncbi:hypothetical protein RJT34_15753 [Clitoria ternatea]|uniref:Uncharacterized protein n=1 Tax=Clitoria ternatea TaxID=43366 RepID=A0AAN9J6A0_CLITE